MPHFYVNPKDIINNTFKIEGEQFHYLLNVRRFCEGDLINLFDGLGNCFSAKIENINKKSLSGKIISVKTFVMPETKICLYTAVPKGERFEWLIEKTSEIGVYKIIPVIYERSVVKEISANKAERYRKISVSASSQSWRGDIMEILNPVKFYEIAEKASNQKDVLNILPWESEENKKISQALGNTAKNINIFIGPEGGFTKQEIDIALKNNFKLVTLGKNILRIETAAISAAAIILSLIQD